MRKLLAAEIAPVNDKLAKYEQIKAWDLVPQEFTLEGGELTPTQKVKRRAIDKHYKALIDSLYDEAERSGVTDSHAIL